MIERTGSVAVGKAADLTTAATLNNGSPIRYGFGLVPGNVLGHATVSHGGGINRFAAASLFVPADSLNIAVSTNIDAEPADPLASNLLRTAYGAAPVAPRPPAVGPHPRSRSRTSATFSSESPSIHRCA